MLVIVIFRISNDFFFLILLIRVLSLDTFQYLNEKTTRAICEKD